MFTCHLDSIGQNETREMLSNFCIVHKVSEQPRHPLRFSCPNCCNIQAQTMSLRRKCTIFYPNWKQMHNKNILSLASYVVLSYYIVKFSTEKI